VGCNQEFDFSTDNPGWLEEHAPSRSTLIVLAGNQHHVSLPKLLMLPALLLAIYVPKNTVPGFNDWCNRKHAEQSC